MFLSGHLRTRDKGLFDILDLFAHLLDKDFELDCALGGVGIDGLGAEGVRLAVELLHHKVQTTAAGAAFVQDLAGLGEVHP